MVLNRPFAGSKSVLKPIVIPGTICCDDDSRVRDQEVAAQGHGVRVPLPGQRLVEAVGRRPPPARTVRRVPVGGVGRRGDRVASAVGERAGVVPRRERGPVAEVRGSVVGRHPAAQLGDEVLRQDGAHAERQQRPRGHVVALVRCAREPRVGVVQVVRRPLGGDLRPRSVEAVVVRQVVVESDRRLVLEQLARALPHVVVVERIAGRCTRTGGPDRIAAGEHAFVAARAAEDGTADRRAQTSGPGRARAPGYGSAVERKPEAANADAWRNLIDESIEPNVSPRSRPNAMTPSISAAAATTSSTRRRSDDESGPTPRAYHAPAGRRPRVMT